MRTVRLLQERRTHPHEIHAVMATCQRQVIRARRYVRRPETCTRPRREVVRIQDVNQHEAQDQHQNARHRPIVCYEQIA